jgi:hypothetical protein
MASGYYRSLGRNLVSMHSALVPVELILENKRQRSTSKKEFWEGLIPKTQSLQEGLYLTAILFTAMAVIKW